MKISIITTSYNQGSFIESTIKSVLSQGIEEMEYIVVDGGSTDKTISILEKYSDRLKYISEPDKGQTDAINKGLKMSSGDIVGWLNSDDLYYKDTLKIVLNYFKKNPDCIAIYGDYSLCDEKGKILKTIKEIPFDKNIFLYGINYICQPTVFLRKEIFNKVGLLNDKLQYCMDLDFWLRIVTNGFKFDHISEKLAIARLHSQSKTVSCREKMQIEIISCREKYGWKPGIKSLFLRVARQLKKLIYRHQFNIIPGDIKFSKYFIPNGKK